MSEKVIIKQNNQYQTNFWAIDPNKPGSEEFKPVERLHELTPYGMLLASLADCTAQVVHAYAHNHNIPLREVELREAYHCNYREDCDNCEDIDRYEEHIEEQIAFQGELNEDTREKLFKIAHQCPIMKMLETNIEIESELLETLEVAG
jgi:uncharacterized OsmC-like protein